MVSFCTSDKPAAPDHEARSRVGDSRFLRSGCGSRQATDRMKLAILICPTDLRPVRGSTSCTRLISAAQRGGLAWLRAGSGGRPGACRQLLRRPWPAGHSSPGRDTPSFTSPQDTVAKCQEGGFLEIEASYVKSEIVVDQWSISSRRGASRRTRIAQSMRSTFRD